jgi:5'-phosphate synthase pdxT subunit
MPIVGILALQGCVDPHLQHLRKIGAEARLVRAPADLTDLAGLILPGGESTTMIRTAKQFGLWQLLAEKAREIPFWGICAGAILMAKEVENPAQESLAVMDLSVRRNAYGRQLESFQQEIEVEGREEAAVFIRAPKFLTWGEGVKVLSEVRGEAVFLDDGKRFVTAFHPELTDSSWCHERFLRRVSRRP